MSRIRTTRQATRARWVADLRIGARKARERRPFICMNCGDLVANPGTDSRTRWEYLNDHMKACV